ncbi:hypothetical protein CROQUDRAFT_98816 [Cronartium quercuum f. sp. fusiforme G11]|uniref:Uncharacterized protein n=1 Tax=Cronartium quercuum f. sp. fusiforme G11 TaxID=708437 RepID=A0A9P6T6Z9_9BASI|nr:hypothetical protein CROQUDRAFT_98816 [Cronartium quercuum f. sp. fusiforme G11]
MFPIVNRQAEVLAQLGPQIALRARAFLCQRDVGWNETAAALASILLLDNTSLLETASLLLQAQWTSLDILLGSKDPGPWMEWVQKAIKLVKAGGEGKLMGEARLKTLASGPEPTLGPLPLPPLMLQLDQLLPAAPRIGGEKAGDRDGGKVVVRLVQRLGIPTGAGMDLLVELLKPGMGENGLEDVMGEDAGAALMASSGDLSCGLAQDPFGWITKKE